MNIRTIVRGVAALGVIGFAGAAAAQPDRWLDTPTGWGLIYGAGPAQINNAISTGSRPFSIELAATGQPSTYDTLFVGNSGPYAVTGAQLAYGQTPAALSNWLNTNGLRLLDLEAFDNGNGAHSMTAVAVPNSGTTAAPGWGWLYGVTAAQISDWIGGTNLRLIDLDVYTLNGTKYYSAVAVPNVGTNAHGWWVYYNITESEVVQYLTQNSARLTSLAVESGGLFGSPPRYTVVMIDDNPGAGWFSGSLSSQQVSELTSQYGARLTCLLRFTNFAGQTRFAVAMVDNANTQTRRVRDILWANTDGITGFTLKQVGGPWLAGVNETFKFEPASSVKLLHGIYAILQCADWDDLDFGVAYRNECDPCPFTWTCNLTGDTVGNSIRRMLEPSDNYALIALEMRYTVEAINLFADAIKCPNIQINRQDCQCGEVLNTATAAEMASLMEQAMDGSLFSSAWREELLLRMNDLDEQGYGTYPTLSNVINQEAAAINLPTAVRNMFRTEVRYANKGGAYGCSPPAVAWGTEAGWASLPRKIQFIGGQWVSFDREYVFALYGHNASTLPTIVFSLKEEMLREQIAEALWTWKNACKPEIGTQPQGTSVSAGATVGFECEASAFGQTVAYQWRRNGVNLANQAGHIAGATGPALTITGVTSADAGTYTCLTTTGCGTELSNGAVLSVTCYPDCSGSGTLTVADFTCFQTKFVAGDPYADCNASGTRTVADFTCFQTRFVAGCP